MITGAICALLLGVLKNKTAFSRLPPQVLVHCLPQAACRLRSRSVLPAVLSGEQLAPRDAGRPLPVCVPVRLAALLAVRVPRDAGPGERCRRSGRTVLCRPPRLMCNTHLPLTVCLQPRRQEKNALCRNSLSICDPVQSRRGWWLARVINFPIPYSFFLFLFREKGGV